MGKLVNVCNKKKLGGNFMNIFANFINDEEGATIAEYALLLGLILVAVVTVVTAFGTNISSAVSKASGKLVT